MHVLVRQVDNSTNYLFTGIVEQALTVQDYQLCAVGSDLIHCTVSSLRVFMTSHILGEDNFLAL